MNRREFMERGVIALSATQAGDLLHAAAPGAEGETAQSWLSERPLIIVGSWDDMPIFRNRVGGGTVGDEEDYRRQHTEEAVAKLKDLGVTMAIIDFFKGFGLQAERSHIDDAIKLAALCHRYDIKVGVYVGSTIAYETFLLEAPEAAEWFVPDYLGKPVIYARQTFRKRVYFMHPGYREYVQRVLKVAIEEVHADLIHFDNTSMQAQPPIFQHPLAMQDFRQYLTTTYEPEELEKRFGFRDPRYVLTPQVDWVLTEINDPLFQDFTRFRCVMLARYYQEMADYIHSLNPAAAVESNPSSGLAGANVYWSQGVDYPRLLASMQAVWTEEGDAAGVTADDILVSKIRTYKMATHLGNKIFTYTGVSYAGPEQKEAQIKVEMAEAMAYNRQCLGMIGDILSAHDLPPSAKKYVRFFTENFHLYRDVETVADVAVLHDFESLAFNNDRPYDSTWLFEQVLIQAKVPFKIVFDAKDLADFHVLVLADQECVGSTELISQWVANGQGLVATGLTSLYTGDRKLRRDFALADLLGVHAPRLQEGEPVAHAIRSGPPVRREWMKGRVVYIPEVKPALARPSGESMTSKYWKLPVNWPELVDAVKWAAGGMLSLDVTAPLSVTAELLHQKQSGGFVLHLINYDAARNPTVKDVRVRLDAGKVGKVRQVALHSPDLEGIHNLPFSETEGQVRFSVPVLETYGVVQITV